MFTPQRAGKLPENDKQKQYSLLQYCSLLIEYPFPSPLPMYIASIPPSKCYAF